LHSRIIIKVVDYSILYDEKVIGGGDGFAFISQLEAQVTFSNLDYTASQAIFESFYDVMLQQLDPVSNVPVTGSRRYYAPLYDDDNFEFKTRPLDEYEDELPPTHSIAHAIEGAGA
jgi:hypothetical protein